VTRLVTGLLLLALMGTPAASGQRRPSRVDAPAGWQTFIHAFDAYAMGDSVVGASVLVMRDGRVLAHHEYGFADRALGQRVDERTIFHWGSITKTLTAVAVMQLRDRKRLSLDDRVTRYIPELRQMRTPPAFKIPPGRTRRGRRGSRSSRRGGSSWLR